MYGTVARMRVREGHLEELQALMDRWDREHRPDTPGFVASHVYRLDRDPDELLLVVVFRDRDAYVANADSPEQDEWYRGMREHLVADPEWEDGEVIWST